ALPSVVALAPLEPCPLRRRSRERRPLHGDPSLLRVVRVERARTRRARHRAPLRPPRRRRACAQALRTPGRGTGTRARPRRVHAGPADADAAPEGVVRAVRETRSETRPLALQGISPFGRTGRSRRKRRLSCGLTAPPRRRARTTPRSRIGGR